jgi:hypothetical protein
MEKQLRERLENKRLFREFFQREQLKKQIAIEKKF